MAWQKEIRLNKNKVVRIIKKSNSDHLFECLIAHCYYLSYSKTPERSLLSNSTSWKLCFFPYEMR